MSTFPGQEPPVIDGQLSLADTGEREPVETVLYVHRDKDSNWSLWENDLAPEGASEDAGRNFAYTLYELGIACRVDLDSGDVTVYGVMDKGEVVRLEREIKGN
jgi:hypothetical protein